VCEPSLLGFLVAPFVLKEESVMNARVSLTARKLKWLAPLLAVVLLAGVANAQQCLSVPDQFPGIPAYGLGCATRGVPTPDNDWCASVCYRPPECTPNNVNLLTFVHLDLLEPSRAAECPFLLEGFMIWEDGKVPYVDQPSYWELHDIKGVGVPIWFFTKKDKYQAIQNGVLKIQEFEKMESLLKGIADHYYEILDLNASPGDALLKIVASGALEDGRRFSMHYEMYGGGITNLAVTFK
jgi:hypothetical protein